MERLTQAIFYDTPEWIKSARITRTGIIWGYNLSLSEMKEWEARGKHMDELKFVLLGSINGATDWCLSAIDREVTK